MNRQIIKKQIWDINLDSEEHMLYVQEEIGRISRDLITPVMEEVCDELLDPNTTLKIDNIDLDIGSISLDKMEVQLINIFREKFRTELQKNIFQIEQNSAKGSSFTPEVYSKIDLLEFFLFKGTLPWWISQNGKTNLNVIFLELNNELSEELQVLVRKGIKYERFRKRLAYQFSPEIFILVIKIVEPTRLKTIESLSKELQLILAEIKEIDQNLISQYFIRFLILSYLSDQNKGFQEKDLCIYLIKNIADKLNLHFNSIINHCKKAIENLIDKKHKPSISLHVILIDLHKQVISSEESIKQQKNEKKNKLSTEFLSKPNKVKAVFKEELSQAVEKSKQVNDVSENEIFDSHSKLDLIKYFLNTGKLPKWASLYGDFDLKKIIKELFLESKEEIIEVLRKGMNNENFRYRFALQSSKEIIYSVLEILEPDNTETIKILTDDLQLIIKEIDKKEFGSNILMFHVLSYLDVKKNKFNEKDIVLFLLNNLAHEFDISLAKIIELSKQTAEKLNTNENVFNSILPVLLKEFHEQIIIDEETIKNEMKIYKKGEYSKESKDIKTESEEKAQKKARAIKEIESQELQQEGKIKIRESEKENEEIIKQQPASSQSKDIKRKVELLFKDGKETVDDSSVNNEQESNVVDEYYINNAGLLILWPFLIKFFENLGFVENHRFFNVEYTHRAVHILQYLASGDQLQAEYNLTLNKVLCGIPIYEPIPQELELTKNEIIACDELLVAVIKNWSALKNTSINVLRESFFMRNGKLSKEQDKWILRIEKKAFDILLDKMPWSINMVKLPWMKDILYVEW